MSKRYVYLLAFGLVFAACGGGNGSGDDDPITDGGGVDADTRPGCSALSPRSVPPETFVGPDGTQQRMISLIDGATETLDIFMYLWTVRPIADRVIAAKNRGVRVRVIFDPDHEGNGTVRNMLTSAGVPNRNNSSLYSFSHAKYMVIDSDTAVIMSMNWNVDAMDRERNYGMIDRDPLDVEDLQAIFDQDWAVAGSETPMPADLACTRLIVSPSNSANRIRDLINSAEDTLELQIMYLSETSVRDAVIAAAKRGVTTRVIFDDPQDESIPLLKAAGVSVRRSTASYYLHAKLIVADGVVFVGSENMSLTSLTRNREVGALVFEPGPAQVITQQFETDWSAGPAL